MTLSGKVVDAHTGQALIGAKIVLPGQNKVVYTDPEGNFEIDAPIGNETELTIEYISYQDTKLRAQTLPSDDVIELHPK